MAKAVNKKVRGFELISTVKAGEVSLPVRKTAKSAGYDMEAMETVIFHPHEVIAVPTGVKAFMQDDEYLGVHVRSSIAIKRGLMMVNAQGIIDADYYNNADNEGHIFVCLYNKNPFPVTIEKGERIAQGIFYKYLLADNDNASAERTGGMGSTGK